MGRSSLAFSIATLGFLTLEACGYPYESRVLNEIGQDAMLSIVTTERAYPEALIGQSPETGWLVAEPVEQILSITYTYGSHRCTLDKQQIRSVATRDRDTNKNHTYFGSRDVHTVHLPPCD